MIQKCRFYDVEKWGSKIVKNRSKMTPYKFVKKRPKSAQKLICHGGSKSSKIDLGDPGPQKRNFLKFCSFLQKLPHFSTPKSTPINGAIKMRFPTKTPVLLLRGGSKNVTFWGVGGRTARTEKCRHYYIANFGFGGSKVVQFYRFFTPAASARYR
jgi:hypothetical protein